MMGAAPIGMVFTFMLSVSPAVYSYHSVVEVVLMEKFLWYKYFCKVLLIQCVSEVSWYIFLFCFL